VLIVFCPECSGNDRSRLRKFYKGPVGFEDFPAATPKNKDTNLRKLEGFFSPNFDWLTAVPQPGFAQRGLRAAVNRTAAWCWIAQLPQSI
jgi:hypothetical protein